MRSKLSQPLSGKGRQGGSSPAIPVTAERLIGATLLFFAAMGCPLANQRSETEAASLSPLSDSASTPGPARDEFHWPTASNHSVIQLDVATPDNEGTIEIELMPELAPESVERISQLVRAGHYDGTTFHRVIRGFMIQGGDPKSRDRDPTNDGTGGSDHGLPDEHSAAPFVRGVVALANRGQAGSNSSQFFILQSDQHDLDGRYTVIGRVVTGMEFVDHIANTPTDRVGRWGPKDRPIENVRILSADFAGSTNAASSPAPPMTDSPRSLDRSQRQANLSPAPPRPE